MKKVKLSHSVDTAIERLKTSLLDRGFSIFTEIDHRKNAQEVDLDMRASRVLLFGNSQAGTMLMQKDIFMSLDLPLRLAVVEDGGDTWLVHQDSSDFTARYQIQNHPVLEKIDSQYQALITELTA